MSRATETAGFRDSFREAHPDPVAVPGFTWSPGGPECDPNEVHDRIDWVLVSGPATTVASEILGEIGGADVTYAVDRFPSDHRAVVSTFRVAPAAAPVLIAVAARRVFIGDVLTVAYRAAPGDARIALMPSGGPASTAVQSRSVEASCSPHRAVAFDTSGLSPGGYDAALLDGADRVLSRSPFWLYPRDTSTELSLSKSVFKVGESIPVSWRAAPGNRWDWLTLIPAPGQAGQEMESDKERLAANRRYLRHMHIDARIEGTARFDENSPPGSASWPLGPGSYQIRLLLDDGLRTLASSPTFKIEP